MKSLLKLVAISLIVSGCSWKQVAHRNEVKKGHFELYSAPEKKVEKVPEGYKRLVLVATNDILGNFQPTIDSISEINSQYKYDFNIGGVEGIAAYMRVFKKKFPGEVILVDNGNAFGQKNDHKQDLFYLNYIGYDILTLGAMDFNLKTNYDYQTYLKTLVATSKTPFVFSNLFDLTNVGLAKWDNMPNRYIKEINGIQVGFIHILDPIHIDAIPPNHISGYYLQNPLEVIIKQSQELRREGAKVIILSMNSKLDCTSIPAHELKLPKYKTNFHPIKHQCYEEDSLYKVLKQVPRETIDAVIAGGFNTKINNFINGIPVIQAFQGGHYLSWMELFVNKKHHQVDVEKTLIHDPVKLCHSLLKETQDCYLNESLNNIVQVPGKFLGEIIEVERKTPTRR
jgi:2',3'-cyclic-nucleotide 2'-phosphodiesterase (5'-nucleotidase family)